MKKLTPLLLLFIISCNDKTNHQYAYKSYDSVFFIIDGDTIGRSPTKLHQGETLSLDSTQMMITGYDSVQVVFFMGRWEVNFCYPNKWQNDVYRDYDERRKYKNYDK